MVALAVTRLQEISHARSKAGSIRVETQGPDRLATIATGWANPMRVARRAQILLHRANSRQRVKTLVEIVEQDAATIWQECERYRLGGLDAALYDAPRSGRPPVFFQKRAPGD